MSTAYNNLVLVTKVKLRVVWREFVHSVRTTFEGKFAVATIVAAPFMMKSLLVSSALRQANLSEDSGWSASKTLSVEDVSGPIQGSPPWIGLATEIGEDGRPRCVGLCHGCGRPHAAAALRAGSGR